MNTLDLHRQKKKEFVRLYWEKIKYKDEKNLIKSNVSQFKKCMVCILLICSTKINKMTSLKKTNFFCMYEEFTETSEKLHKKFD